MLTRFSSHCTREYMQAAANLVIAGLWLWLYRGVLPYLGVLFTREEFRTNQIVLLAVLALLIQRAYHARFRPRLSAPPRLVWPGLLLALGSSLLYLAVERWLDINTLSALLFSLGTYGLIGLWMEPARWRAGLPAALLVTDILPFGEHIETFLGYPVRRATAQLVSAGLRSVGVPHIGIDTILVFESGISQVDIPCSGVKSLWTGALFLLAATWVENRPLSLRWLLVSTLAGSLLLAANFIRVAVLVILGEVLGWQLAAELAHVPLGVLGFCACCLAALWLLRKLPPPTLRSQLSTAPAFHPRWLAPALTAWLLASGLFYVPRLPAAAPTPRLEWSFPAELQTRPIPLNPEELEWLTQGGAEWADRMSFQNGQVSGSMILVTSATWRGQHRPERCFEVYGLMTRASQARMAAAGFPQRILTLAPDNSPRHYTAAYWFQSATQTTADYGTRIWSDLTARGQRWVLVTVLLDGATTPTQAELDRFYTALHQVVARSLIEGATQ